MDISKALQAYSSKHHPVGEKLPESAQIYFDGTTHVCEAMVVVLRYVDDDWQIKQQVCHLMLVAKLMTDEEVARQLIATLSTELSIPANHVVAIM